MNVGKRLVAAASLWFSSILMMSMAVFLPDAVHLSGWAILAAIGGCLPVGWLTVEHVVVEQGKRSREEVKDIARIVIAQQRDLHSV